MFIMAFVIVDAPEICDVSDQICGFIPEKVTSTDGIISHHSGSFHLFNWLNLLKKKKKNT